MGKNKLKKFAQVQAYSHVFEPTFNEIKDQDHPLKGKWSEEFGNDHPIVLELACGKGEYSTGMAEVYPNKNFIGIDIKGARIYTGAKIAHDNSLNNVRFLRTKIDLIKKFFADDEISEIWILFADPQLGKPRKRLTSHLFLNRYKDILKNNGSLHLKCDSTELYEFTKLESIPAFNNAEHDLSFQIQFDTDKLYEEGIHKLDETLAQVLRIKTFYEQRWLEEGKKIKYLSYRKAGI